ncbi:MAG TPA: hypothetical protein VNS58_13775 [Puia sp.]|nr:hypothetical protein [Puia sp.]
MIESISTIYRELFTIQLIHSGYETPQEIFLQKGISITPDSATRNLFINYSMNYRYYNNTLLCFIQCVPSTPPAPDPKVPFVAIQGNIRWRFLLHNSSDFFNKTYVTAAGSKKMYQFSNQVNNTNGGNLFLSNPVANYSSFNDYDVGTIVQSGGNLYVSLQPVLAADGIALSNINFWKLLQPVEQVVSNADLQDTATVQADETCFGVIDMYNSGTTNNSYKLLDTGGKLLKPAPAFTIKFKSRI